MHEVAFGPVTVPAAPATLMVTLPPKLAVYVAEDDGARIFLWALVEPSSQWVMRNPFEMDARNSLKGNAADIFGRQPPPRT